MRPQAVKYDPLPMRHPENIGDLGELGLISEIVSAAGDAANLLMHVFKKPPADTWSTWDYAHKKQYVKEALQLSTASEITGKSFSFENTFRKLIAQVSVNYGWDKWQKKNSSFMPAIGETQNEVRHYKQYGYRPQMEYINPQIIKNITQPAKPATASMFSGNNSMLFVVAALTVAGGMYYYYNVNRIKKLKS